MLASGAMSLLTDELGDMHQIPWSFSQVRHRGKATGQPAFLQLHRHKARTSPVARWHSDATGYEQLTPSATLLKVQKSFFTELN